MAGDVRAGQDQAAEQRQRERGHELDQALAEGWRLQLASK